MNLKIQMSEVILLYATKPACHQHVCAEESTENNTQQVTDLKLKECKIANRYSLEINLKTAENLEKFFLL